MHRLAAMAEGAGANTPNTSPCCACICATLTAWETDAITETHWPSCAYRSLLLTRFRVTRLWCVLVLA